MNKYLLLIVFIFTSTILKSDDLVPESLIGEWGGFRKSVVRYEVETFSFKFEIDSVDIKINIFKDGRVEGNVGDAKLKNCKFSFNRGWFGKTFNLATDYIIKGELEGSIFEKDSIQSKKISIPFNLDNNLINGTLFHKFSIDLYPIISDFVLNKVEVK